MIVGNDLVTPYSHEQINSLLTAVVFHYTISQCLLECLEFPIETNGEVSVACMHNVHHFIAQAAYRLTQDIHIDLHEFHIGISYYGYYSK